MLTYADVAAPAYVSIAACAAHATREEEFLGPLLCVFILLYVSSHNYICVLILLYIQVQLMQREDELLRARLQVCIYNTYMHT